MPVRRAYVLDLNDRDSARPNTIRAAEIFEWAARSLRAEAAGTGPVVSHERECYGTPAGTLYFVPQEIRDAD